MQAARATELVVIFKCLIKRRCVCPFKAVCVLLCTLPVSERSLRDELSAVRLSPSPVAYVSSRLALLRVPLTASVFIPSTVPSPLMSPGRITPFCFSSSAAEIDRQRERGRKRDRERAKRVKYIVIKSIHMIRKHIVVLSSELFIVKKSKCTRFSMFLKENPGISMGKETEGKRNTENSKQSHYWCNLQNICKLV